MSKPLFSISAICKNEQNTLPKMLFSLKPFFDRGGECVILDTGSTDNSVEIAKSLGATVYEVGEKFIEIIKEEEARKINNKFVVYPDTAIVKEGGKLFHFANARNHVSSLASNDFILTMDCDEEYTVFNIDEINRLISEGYEQFEYEFIYAHDANGNPVVSFTQSKAYDRRKLKWTNCVHEVLSPTSDSVKRIYIDRNTILLEHWQEQGKEHRGNYMTGLAVDCFRNQQADRNSFYCAREMMYSSRYKSAILEFERHQKFNAWPAERAQGLIYIGDCYQYLGNAEKQVEYYHKAFQLDPNRRESLIKLAYAMKERSEWNGVAAYAAAALEIGNSGYYANEMAHYTHVPHELLYDAKGKVGEIEAAKWHLMKCLKYQPNNPKFIHDTVYYFPYPCNNIDGWLSYEEQLFLFELGRRFNGEKIAEIGSFAGRSTVCLATGNKDGVISAIDTWEGSQDIRDDTSWIYQQRDIYSDFKNNTKDFKNIVSIKKSGNEASKDFEDGSLSAVFIDAEHTKDAVIQDCKSWLPKIKKGGVICGHDYKPTLNGWITVVEGVDSVFTKPDGVVDTIWFVNIK